MKKIDNSEIIRNYFNYIENIMNIYTNKGYSTNENYMYSLLSMYFNDLSVSTMLPFMGEQKVNEERVRIALMEAVLSKDLYVYLNLINKLQGLEDRELSLFLELKECLEDGTVNSLFINSRSLKYIRKATLSYKEASAFDKVLYVKALDENDINLLSKYNPLFMDEYNHFNVELNNDFLIRQITKWINAFKDENKAYMAAASFICNLYHINKELVNDYLVELSKGYTDDSLVPMIDYFESKNITEIADMVKDFYLRNKDIKEIKR